MENEWQHLVEGFARSPLSGQCIAGAGVLFALVFLIVGSTRIVEFDGLVQSRLRRTLLSVLHILGCAIFSSMLILLALDMDRRHDLLLGGLLTSSVILLFPIHIYLGILRRLRSAR